jgi:putative toxin-antitoxin system antitoxin component (TIGR02293 family)
LANLEAIPWELTIVGKALSVTELLGGEEALGSEIRSPADAIRLVKQGMPVRAVCALMAHLGVSQSEFAVLTGISKRTIARRLAGERLSLEESNRVFRLANILVQAVEVLGSEDKARVWLARPNRALGGQAPLQLLDTDIGTDEVKKALGRIAYGVFG